MMMALQLFLTGLVIACLIAAVLSVGDIKDGGRDGRTTSFIMAGLASLLVLLLIRYWT